MSQLPKALVLTPEMWRKASCLCVYTHTYSDTQTETLVHTVYTVHRAHEQILSVLDHT